MDQLVSVIIPTYNRPAQLKRALDAVFDQTHRAVEAVVVNDGGCSIEHVTASHPAAGRIRCLVQQGNKGPNAARNVGLRAARGTYVAYLDDDDRWRPDHLATVLGAMARQDTAVGYADALEVRVRYEEGRRIEVARSRPFSCEFDADRLALWPHIPTLCIVHRRSCLEQGGYFDESLQRCEDWEMWLRLSRAFPFAHVAQTTCEFDTVLNGGSLRALGVGPHLEATLAIRSKHDGWMRRTRYAALFYPLFLRQLRSLWATQPGQVIGLLERVAEITDYRADALADLGFLHAKCGQHEAARDALGRAIAISPHHPAALVTLARLEDEAGATGRAQTLLQAALNADPYNEDARREHDRLAAGLSAGTGGFPLPQVRIPVDTTPNDAFVWDAVDIAQPEPWRGIVVDPSVERELTATTAPRTVATAYLLWLAGRRRADDAATAAAELRLVDCLDAEPWHPEVLSTLDVLVGFASGLEERGKSGLATRVFGRLASLLKGQEGMHEVEAMVDYRLGKLALESGNLADATQAFEDCLSLQPNHGQAAAALHEATRQRVLRRLSPAASPSSAEGRVHATDGPRLFVIDQNLRGAGGHFLAYDSSVARAAAAVGIAPMLVANRHVRVSPDGLPVHGVLPYTSWEELSSMPAHAYDHFAERATSTAWRLADFFAEHDVTEHDVVFAPNATIVTAQALARLALLSGRAFPRTALLYRMELAEQIQFTGLGPRVGTAILRQALADIVAAIPSSAVRLYTDSDELTEEYAGATGRRFTTAPIPVEAEFSKPWPVPQGPTTVLYLGDARTEKGYLHLPQVAAAFHEELRSKRLEFILQSNFNVAGGEPGIAQAVERLSGMPGVTAIRAPLSEPEYLDLMRRADIVLLPYQADRYVARTSGILAEAISAGVPSVVPAGTWLADQLRRFGEGAAVSTTRPEEIVEGIRRLLPELPHRRARALLRRGPFLEFHNPDRLMRFVCGEAALARAARVAALEVA